MLRNTVERILRAGILDSCYSPLREGFNRVRWGHFGASKYCPVCEKQLSQIPVVWHMREFEARCALHLLRFA